MKRKLSIPKNITLDKEAIRKATRMARSERRSFSNFVSYLIDQEAVRRGLTREAD